MASDLNNVTLVGRLTIEPVLKYLSTGMAVLEFSIANNYYVSSKGSNEVNFFEITIYGKTAESISKYLTKGKQVAISGNLRQERWQDKETNSSRSRIRIIAQNIQMLGNSNNNDIPMSDNNNMNNNYMYNNNLDNSYESSSSGIELSNFNDDDDEVPF